LNLFVTDEDPAEAARGLDDKRVVKLILECAQMLSVAVSSRGAPLEDTFFGDGRVMRPTHANHPVTKWVGLTQKNWIWTFTHAVALAGTYERAYNRQHSCLENLGYFVEHRLWQRVPPGPLTPFQNSARNGVVDFSWIEPTTEAYRQYLMARWRTDKRPVTFRNRVPPEWVDRSLIKEIA
jgi:hypothetical protein